MGEEQLVEGYKNLIAFDAYRVGLDGEHGGQGSDGARAHVKAPAVPGTFDFAVDQFAVAKGAAVVRAQILGREKGPFPVCDKYAVPVRRKRLHLPGGYIGRFGYWNKVCHNDLLPSSGLGFVVLVPPIVHAVGSRLDDLEGKEGAFDAGGAERYP